MNDGLNWLVTVLYDGTLLRCALRIDKWDIPSGMMRMVMDDPNGVDSRDVIRKLLPLHVRSCGPVVEVTSLFDIHVRDAAARQERDGSNAGAQI